VIHLGLGIQAATAGLFRRGRFYPDHGLERMAGFHERQDRRYESRVRVWRGGAISRADDAPELVDAWRPSLATNAAGDVLAVWQDLRNVTNGIRFATGTGASITFEASARVDDPAADAHSFGPQIARLGDRIMVVWEDTRSAYARARLVTSD
jgi:hypothetical protein